MQEGYCKMISDEEAKEIKKQLLQQIEKIPKEQVPGLKEKIQEMNNKELEEFVKEKTKNACIFCQIIQGQIKAYKVFEDNKFIVVLDIMPATRGHIIILPKKHIQFLHQMSDEETKDFFLLAKKIIPILIQITKCQGADIYISQGISQKIPHLALNLIPRYQDDKISFDWERKPAQEKELQELSNQISLFLNKIKEEEHKQNQKVKQKEEESEAQKLMKHIQERIP
jgi:histidine triad (HIT) family protein